MDLGKKFEAQHGSCGSWYFFATANNRKEAYINNRAILDEFEVQNNKRVVTSNLFDQNLASWGLQALQDGTFLNRSIARRVLGPLIK